MRPVTFSVPFLPPSLNVYRNEHWRKHRGEEKTWKDYIAVKWAEMGRPKLNAIRIGMVFTFPDRRTRDLDNYLATGSKLVGDAVKGLFIPDDGPEHLTAWSFRFEFGDEAKTTVVIEEADGKECVSSGRGFEGHSAEGSRACRLYEDCIAPLCPLDRISLRGVWYPDDEICRSRTHGNLPWISSQRKIARAGASGYFTLEILNSIRTIRKGITGLDPNVEEKPQLRRWLEIHEKKRISESPQTGVSPLSQNVSKQGGQVKILCRDGGSRRPDPVGTGKPPSRRGRPA